MPTASRPIFANGNFYHVYNRGVEKRKIFLDRKDYFRFIHNLYEFNDEDLVNVFRHPISNVGTPSAYINPKKRKLLVDIVCYCLMPNHFHLILEQLKEGGISKFMQKLGGGYTNYFNLKYERSGVLFQGKFKAVFIETDNQLIHTSRYIHLNPVELIEPQWKEKGIKNWKKVKEFLESYRWSSYLDYIGEKNFPSVIKKDFLFEYFDNNEKDYEKFVYEWAIDDFAKIEDLSFE